MKKSVLLLIALVLLSIIVSACAPKSTVATDPAAETTSKPAETTSPAKTTQAETTTAATEEDEEPAKLVVLVADHNDPSFPLNMDRPTMQRIHDVLLEKFNVDWSIESIMGERFDELLNTRLAAATDLPDMIKHRLSDARLVEVYESGLIIALNDLIDEYAPEVKYAFEEDMPYLTVANSTADGVILRVPQVVANIQHQVTVLGVRKDFCDKVGLDLPKTTDDFYNMLVTFNTEDVNESGSEDVVFWPSYGNMNYSLATAFGVYGATNAAGSWWYDNDKKLFNSLLTDNAREYISYIQKLYSEGYIAQPFTNYTTDMWNEAVYANKVAATVGAWWDGVIMTSTLESREIKGEHITLPNLVKNEGDPSVNILKNLGGYQGLMITKECERPDKAMQVINYGYTLEGSTLDYFGEIYPGGDYYEAIDESKYDVRLHGLLSKHAMDFTEKGQAEQDKNPNIAAFRNEMGWNTAVLGQYLIGTAGDIAQEYYYTFTVERCGLAAEIDWNLDNLNYFMTEGIANVGFVAPNSAQKDALDEFADLFTYMDENIQKFMMNTRSMDEWDAFVAECQGMGIDDAAVIRQELFDGYVAIMDSMGAPVFTQ